MGFVSYQEIVESPAIRTFNLFYQSSNHNQILWRGNLDIKIVSLHDPHAGRVSRTVFPLSAFILGIHHLGRDSVLFPHHHSCNAFFVLSLVIINQSVNTLKKSGEEADRKAFRELALEIAGIHNKPSVILSPWNRYIYLLTGVNSCRFGAIDEDDLESCSGFYETRGVFKCSPLSERPP